MTRRPSSLSVEHVYGYADFEEDEALDPPHFFGATRAAAHATRRSESPKLATAA